MGMLTNILLICTDLGLHVPDFSTRQVSTSRGIRQLTHNESFMQFVLPMGVSKDVFFQFFCFLFFWLRSVD